MTGAQNNTWVIWVSLAAMATIGPRVINGTETESRPHQNSDERSAAKEPAAQTVVFSEDMASALNKKTFEVEIEGWDPLSVPPKTRRNVKLSGWLAQPIPLKDGFVDRLVGMLREGTGCSFTPYRESNSADNQHRRDVSDILHSDSSGMPDWLRDAVDFSDHCVKIRTLISTVPDPRQSHMALQFDQFMEVLTSAAAASGFIKDRFYFPWKTRSEKESKHSDGNTDETDGPGLILFRRAVPSATSNTDDTSNELLAVFLVRESPVLGVQRDDLQRVLTIADAITSDKSAPIRVVGPLFSGSAVSLSQELKKFCRPHEKTCTSQNHIKRKVPVVMTGTATATGVEKTIRQSGAGFFRTIAEDEELLSFFQEQICLHDKNAKFILLSEIGTGYGNMFAARDTGKNKKGGKPNRRGCRSADCVQQSMKPLQFPLHISTLQAAREQSRNTESNANTPPTLRKTLELKLESDESDDEDIPPLFSDLTHYDIELNFRQSIRKMCSYDAPTYVMIAATNPADVLFLTDEIRTYCPEAAVATLGGDMLFIHPDVANSMSGTIVASSYPLLFGNRSLKRGNRQTHAFSSYSSQGYYNAVRAQLIQMTGPLRLRLSGYRSLEKRSNRKWGPQLWLTMIFKSNFWPLATRPASTGSLYRPPDKPRGELPNHDNACRTWTIGRNEVRTTRMANFLAIAILVAAFLHVVFFVFAPLVIWLRTRSENRSIDWRSDRCCYVAACHLAIAGTIALTLPAALFNWITLPTWLLFVLIVFLFVLFVFPLLVRIVTIKSANPSSSLISFVWIQIKTALFGQGCHPTAYRAVTLTLCTVVMLFFAALGLNYVWQWPGGDVAISEDDIQKTAALCVQEYKQEVPQRQECFDVELARRRTEEQRQIRKHTQATLVAARSFDPLGMSPLSPLLYLAIALYVWGFCGLRRLKASASFSSQSPLGSLPSKHPLHSAIQSVQGIFEGRLWVSELIVIAFLLLHFCNFHYRIHDTFEGHEFDMLLRGGLYALYGAVLLSLVRFIQGCWIVIRFLRLVIAQPMLDAIDRVSLKVRGSFGLRLSAREPETGELELSVYNLRTLASVATSLSCEPKSKRAHLFGGIAAKLMQHTQTLKPLMNGNANTCPPASAQGDNPTGQAQNALIQNQTTQSLFLASGDIFGALRRLWRIRSRDSQVNIVTDSAELSDLLPKGDRDDVPTAAMFMRAVPDNVYLWTRMAEDFVMMRVVTFVIHHLAQLRKQLVFTWIGAFLFLMSVQSYPLQPSRLIMASAIMLVGAVTVGSFVAMIWLEKNDVLRRLSGAGSGNFALKSAFLTRLLIYILLPATALIANISPELGNFLFSWIEPLGRLMP